MAAHLHRLPHCADPVGCSRPATYELRTETNERVAVFCGQHGPRALKRFVEGDPSPTVPAWARRRGERS